MINPTTKDIGRKVVYARGNQPFDEGVITSFTEHYVFARYGRDVHSKAAKREDLEWSIRMARDQ